jgi:hypothetical protein
MLFRFLRDCAVDAARSVRPFRRGAISPPGVERQTGVWHPLDIEWMARLVQHVPGDFAEIGVFRGRAFKVLARQATVQDKAAHAFDSFLGMDEPAPEDGDQYPKGKFSIGGSEKFVELMKDAGIASNSYRIWSGYIPECFAAVPASQRFSLVIIDVDHFKPTQASLQWAGPRINSGGILALDDFLPESDRYATKAIKEFLLHDHDFEELARFNQQLILRKR